VNLRMITEHTGYFEGPVVVGACLISPTEVVLIDSGSDDSAARKIAAHFEKAGINIRAIINTHSHADHCGGNAHIQKRTGCRVFAVGLEAVFIRNPELEPTYLYGAGPHGFMKNKFLQAEPTQHVEAVEFGSLKIEESIFELLDFSGHSPAMTGVRTPDGILFAGDALIGPQTAAKHGMLFHFNLTDHMKTLEWIQNHHSDICVISHGGLCANPGDVAHDNLERLNAVNRWILENSAMGAGREELLEGLMDHFGINPPPALYYLNMGLVSSHLAYLCGSGEMDVRMDGAHLRYFSGTGIK